MSGHVLQKSRHHRLQETRDGNTQVPGADDGVLPSATVKTVDEYVVESDGDADGDDDGYESGEEEDDESAAEVLQKQSEWFRCSCAIPYAVCRQVHGKIYLVHAYTYRAWCLNGHSKVLHAKREDSE